MFKEMQIGELPRITIVVIGISDVVLGYWHLFLPLGLVLLVVPWFVPSKVAKWGCLFVFLCGLAIHELFLLALFEPMITMMQRLSDQ